MNFKQITAVLFAAGMTFGAYTEADARSFSIQKSKSLAKHHITGRAFAECENFMKDVDYHWEVVQTWKIKNRNGSLTQPAADTLTTQSGNPLNRRVIADEYFNGTGSFNLSWKELAFSNRLPWIDDAVYHNGYRERTVRAYRVIELYVMPDEGFPGTGTRPDPNPQIMFYGTETKKYIGDVDVNLCLATYEG